MKPKRLSDRHRAEDLAKEAAEAIARNELDKALHLLKESRRLVECVMGYAEEVYDR